LFIDYRDEQPPETEVGTMTVFLVRDFLGKIDTKSALYFLGVILFIGACFRTIYFLFINVKLIIRESWAESIE
jgi:hypothetical protein